MTKDYKDRFPDKPHGVRARYTKGCRCDLCREAMWAKARSED